MRHALLALAFVLSANVPTTFAHDFTAGPLTIDHPYSLEVPPVSTTAAVYFEVVNGGERPDRLVAVRTPVSERAEVHTMTLEQGVMKMRKLDGRDIPAGESVSFAPGGDHVMLLGLAQPLRAGADFPLTLVFERAGTVEVVVNVEARGADGGDAAKQHSGHGAGQGGHGHTH